MMVGSGDERIPDLLSPEERERVNDMLMAFDMPEFDVIVIITSPARPGTAVIRRAPFAARAIYGQTSRMQPDKKPMPARPPRPPAPSKIIKGG